MRQTIRTGSGKPGIAQLRGLDALVIREGMVYPILSRLKRDGLVRTSVEESPEGPTRESITSSRPRASGSPRK